jgi:hypothetical protein
MLENTNKQRGADPIEQLLGSYSPAPANIDRDQMMFLAGIRAAQAANGELPALMLRPRWANRLWPALAIVSTAAAVILSIVAWQRPERVVVVERSAVEQIAEKQPSPSPPVPMVVPESSPIGVPKLDAALSYLHRRDLLLRDGPEALTLDAPGGSYVARTTPTQRELLKELPGDLRQSYQVDSDAWWQSWLISGDRL